jgi:hypothetical protein
MPMNEAQGRIWKKITHAYQAWDQDRSNLMEIDALPDHLPDVEREAIGQTLAEALADERMVAYEDSGSFRLIPNH